MPPSRVFCIAMVINLFIGLHAAFSQKTIYSAEYLKKKAYADSILRVATLQEDSLKIAEAYYLWGKVELSAGNYLSAQQLFMKSLRIQETFGDSYELGRLYIRLREKEERQGHYDQALSYLKVAIKIFRRINSNLGLMRGYTSMGELYSDTGLQNISKQPKNIQFNIDSASFYFRKAERLSVLLKDTVALADIWVSLGKLSILKNDPQAIRYLQQAINTFTSFKKDNEKGAAMLFLASAYLHFHQPEKVPGLLVQVQQFYEKAHLNSYTWLRSLEVAYVNYYKATSQWEQAFKHLENLKSLERKELVADQEGAITRLEIEYETKKREALLKKKYEELALSKANEQRQQWFLLLLGTLLLITVGLGFFYFRLSRKNKQISQRNAVLIKEQNHRVKNNLQLISSLLSLQSDQFTDDATRKATENNLLRIESMAILHRTLYDKEELAVVNLAEFIKEIVEVVLQTFAYMHVGLDYAVSPVKLSPDQALPIGLIITELLTNACKYAFSDNPAPYLTIVAYKDKDDLILTVADNGPGLKRGAANASFGIKLIQMQVAQLRGSYTFEKGAGTKFSMKCKIDEQA